MNICITTIMSPNNQIYLALAFMIHATQTALQVKKKHKALNVVNAGPGVSLFFRLSLTITLNFPFQLWANINAPWQGVAKGQVKSQQTQLVKPFSEFINACIYCML